MRGVIRWWAGERTRRHAIGKKAYFYGYDYIARRAGIFLCKISKLGEFNCEVIADGDDFPRDTKYEDVFTKEQALVLRLQGRADFLVMSKEGNHEPADANML